MTYLVKFEGSFATKEEAIAFVNLVESIKPKTIPGARNVSNPEFDVKQNCQVWESTHDEETPKPCTLLVNVDFKSSEVEHDIAGVIPSVSTILSNKIVEKIKQQ